MLDHFGFLAPYYDRFIGPPQIDHWQDLLQLPLAGNLLDAGGGTGRDRTDSSHRVDVRSDVSADGGTLRGVILQPDKREGIRRRKAEGIVVDARDTPTSRSNRKPEFAVLADLDEGTLGDAIDLEDLQVGLVIVTACKQVVGEL